MSVIELILVVLVGAFTYRPSKLKVTVACVTWCISESVAKTHTPSICRLQLTIPAALSRLREMAFDHGTLNTLFDIHP